MPLMIAVRAGAHTGCTAHTRVKIIPFFASASTFGVRASASP